VRDLVGELGDQYRVVGSAVLLASGRPLPPLAKILASHALIHAAEGEFFREAFSKACESLDLPVTGFRERDLDACVQTAFGKAATRIEQQISTVGRSLGPPWTKDQKMAAIAALVVLATEASREAAQDSESKRAAERRKSQNRSEPRSGARLRIEASRGAAQECSPRRQPWVVLSGRQSPKGATETSSKKISLPLTPTRGLDPAGPQETGR